MRLTASTRETVREAREREGERRRWKRRQESGGGRGERSDRWGGVQACLNN